ncbi:hypothetical protein [Rufibacter sp. LB8]|uniref:hypothetical protein n=1 Tax=Rufibacter sp. LB8 TaxID=2777781 RepID=UPI00178C68D9|nr:hypothetical protein [Rufibacter sp. LB8]
MNSLSNPTTPENAAGTAMPAGHSMEDMTTAEPHKNTGTAIMPGHEMSSIPNSATPPAMPGTDHANMAGMQRQPANSVGKTGTSKMPEMDHSKMTQPIAPKRTRWIMAICLCRTKVRGQVKRLQWSTVKCRLLERDYLAL